MKPRWPFSLCDDYLPFQVHALPTVFVYKDGKAVTHFKGVLPEAQVKQILDSM